MCWNGREGGERLIELGIGESWYLSLVLQNGNLTVWSGAKLMPHCRIPESKNSERNNFLISC